MLFGKALCTDKYRAMGGCFVYVVIYQLKEKRVSKVFIYEVFELLSQIRAVDSESEFSKDWLGRSECYLRTLRFKQKEPSVGTLAICASKLQHYGKRMVLTEEHKRIGDKFLKLSEKCHQHINAQSEAKWLVS
jgi:hypothetical protein